MGGGGAQVTLEKERINSTQILQIMSVPRQKKYPWELAGEGGVDPLVVCLCHPNLEDCGIAIRWTVGLYPVRMS